MLIIALKCSAGRLTLDPAAEVQTQLGIKYRQTQDQMVNLHEKEAAGGAGVLSLCKSHL